MVRLAEELSARDTSILGDIARVRVLTGRQVERLHFADLTGTHRDRTRRRVLERLVAMNLLGTLERRVGGVHAGSAGLVYCLAAGGQRWRALHSESYQERFRQPSTPTERFMIHNLVISELYVCLREAERTGQVSLVDFRAEPACWWRNSEGEWIKPDALVVVSSGEVEDCWAVEVDNATESLPTLRHKLKVYLDLVANEEHGPGGGPLPRVLITVPNGKRLAAVEGLLRTLPGPASQLFALTTHERALRLIAETLNA